MRGRVSFMLATLRPVAGMYIWRTPEIVVTERPISGERPMWDGAGGRSFAA
jgi:hypothetical protein